MKLSTITSTSIFALAAAALIAGGASAGGGLRSNIYKLDAGNPNAEKQCVEKGGSVKDGMCVMPEGSPQPVEATTVKISGGSGVGKPSIHRTGGTAPPAAESANLNLSKSNINRTGGTAQPAAGATINNGKSNNLRTGCPAGQQMNAETNECNADSAAAATPQ